METQRGPESQFGQFSVLSGRAGAANRADAGSESSESECATKLWDCLGKLPNVVQFYAYFILRTSNGVLLMLQAFVFALLQSTLANYELARDSPMVRIGCVSEPSPHELKDQCAPGAGLFRSLEWAAIIVQVATVMCVGLAYDILSHVYGSRQRVMSFVLAGLTFVVFGIFSIPSAIGLDLQGFMDLFLVGLMTAFAYSFIFIQLNLVAMFAGGYRVAVCMVFTSIYFFTFVCDLLNFATSFVGNGILEIVLFLVLALDWYLVTFRWQC